MSFLLVSSFLAVSLTPGADLDGIPVVEDFKIERVISSINNPTSMVFWGQNDFLVTEKDQRTIRWVVNGALLADPLLDVNVLHDEGKVMFGAAVLKIDSVSYLATGRVPHDNNK